MKAPAAGTWYSSSASSKVSVSVPASPFATAPANAGATVSAAVAFVTAAVPMWAAWQAHRLYSYGATTGQALRGLRVRGAPGRRAARLLLHPVALPLWVWIAATGVLSGSRRIAVIVLGVTAIMMLLTGVTRAFRRPLYDMVTGTRLVRAR